MSLGVHVDCSIEIVLKNILKKNLKVGRLIDWSWSTIVLY